MPRDGVEWSNISPSELSLQRCKYDSWVPGQSRQKNFKNTSKQMQTIFSKLLWPERFSGETHPSFSDPNIRLVPLKSEINSHYFEESK